MSDRLCNTLVLGFAGKRILGLENKGSLLICFCLWVGEARGEAGVRKAASGHVHSLLASTQNEVIVLDKQRQVSAIFPQPANLPVHQSSPLSSF
jgi:hypothetical protein